MQAAGPAFYRIEKEVLKYLLKSPKFALTWDIGHPKTDGERDMSYLLENKRHLRHFHIHNGGRFRQGIIWHWGMAVAMPYIFVVNGDRK